MTFVAFLVFGLVMSGTLAIVWDNVTRDQRRKRLAEVRRSSMQAERAIFDITQQAQAEMVRILMASRQRP